MVQEVDGNRTDETSTEWKGVDVACRGCGATTHVGSAADMWNEKIVPRHFGDGLLRFKLWTRCATCHVPLHVNGGIPRDVFEAVPVGTHGDDGSFNLDARTPTEIVDTAARRMLIAFGVPVLLFLAYLFVVVR